MYNEFCKSPEATLKPSLHPAKTSQLDVNVYGPKDSFRCSGHEYWHYMPWSEQNANTVTARHTNTAGRKKSI